MKIIYRAEIDGLRAIAVGAVIFYHAQIKIDDFQLFQGGFIGVDIFFVISGYLISSIILKELVTTGSFSFKHFYKRRIRRIMPALLFLMLVSVIFAWKFLPPDIIIDFSKSIISSLGFISNLYFHYSGQIYGADSGLLKPFLHTWSLSVEEQYYILFPIFLFITFKYFREYLIYFLLIGFTLSLGFSDWGSRNYPSATFYFLHTRIWELLAGSILAYIEITKGHRSKNKTLNLIFPAVGLLLIGNSILFFNDKMFHPSFYTLIPVIGVCLIIWFSHKDELITKILSTKLFVGVGLISYSLYLWHYPVFAFERILDFSQGIFFKLLLCIVIIVSSVLSYFLIEKPFRNKKYDLKKLLTILLSIFIFLISFNYYIISNEGLKKRLPNIFQTKLREKNTTFFQKENTKKIVLIGDSHADALEFKLNEELKQNNLSLFRFKTRMYLDDFDFVDRKTKKNDENYLKNNLQIEKFLKENSNLIIVFHQRWSVIFLESWFDNEEGYKEESKLESSNYFEPINKETSSLKERQRYIIDGFKSQINKIINQGHKLILIYPVPEMGFTPHRLLYKKYLLDKNLFKNSIPILSGSYEVYKKRNKLIFEVLDSIQDQNIHRIYPHKFFCNKLIINRCIANDENNILYYNDDHLSINGSKPIVDEIINEIKKIKNNYQ